MLGERMTLLRRGYGWSQSELAGRLHISPSAVGMYEQGRREPSLQGLLEIAAVFGVSTDYLLSGKPVSRAEEQTIARLMSQATQRRNANRSGCFSEEELALLFAAMRMDT